MLLSPPTVPPIGFLNSKVAPCLSKYLLVCSSHALRPYFFLSKHSLSFERYSILFCPYSFLRRPPLRSAVREREGVVDFLSPSPLLPIALRYTSAFFVFDTTRHMFLFFFCEDPTPVRCFVSFSPSSTISHHNPPPGHSCSPSGLRPFPSTFKCFLGIQRSIL